MQRILNWIGAWFKGRQTYLQLKEYSIFEQLGSFDLFLLDELMHVRKFQPEEVIFESGYPLEVIYFIQAGEILLKGNKGNSYDKVLRKGQHLGIFDMFHSLQRCSTAIAQSQVVVLGISRTDLDDYIKSRPLAGMKILRAIIKELSNIVLTDNSQDRQ